MKGNGKIGRSAIRLISKANPAMNAPPYPYEQHVTSHLKFNWQAGYLSYLVARVRVRYNAEHLGA